MQLGVSQVRTVGQPLLLCWTLLLCSGCSVTTQFRIFNGTGERLEVTSSHTGRMVPVRREGERDIPHTSGSLTIQTKSGTCWYYSDMTPLQFRGGPYIRRRRFLFSSSLTVGLFVTDEGSLYVVYPKAWRRHQLLPEQPSGFPALPEIAEGRRPEAIGVGVPQSTEP